MNCKVLFLFLLIPILAFCQPQTIADVDRAERIEGRRNADWVIDQPYVIMISIDGFRYDYAEKYQAANIMKLKEKGCSASKLTSVFPSKTFPNHYSIATGLYAGNHGIINNSFYSRTKKKSYSISDRRAVEDGTWYGGTPIWTLAEKQGMLSATFYWIGSEAEIGGFRPNYSFNYDARVSNLDRIYKIINWLKLPPEYRPHLILGYISAVDHEGHDFGTDHPEVGKALQEVDEVIGRLMSELDKLDLDVNLVLVSDHGMADVNQSIGLEKVVDLSSSKVYYGVPTFIYNEDEHDISRIKKALITIPEIKFFSKDQWPGRFHFSNTDREPDLILMADPPYVITRSDIQVKGGTHGFDPEIDEMGGLFIAQGPDFKEGVAIEPFENIHIYPTITALLGLKSPKVDGDPKVLSTIVKP